MQPLPPIVILSRSFDLVNLQESMAQVVERLFDRTVLAHPRLTLLALVAVFAVFLIHARQFDLDASADSLLLDTDPDLAFARTIEGRYGAREFMFVAFTPDSPLLGPESLSVIRDLHRRIGELPQVESVRSVLDVPLLKNAGAARLADVADTYRTLNTPDVDLERALNELTTSPIYGDFVVSRDGTTTALQVFLRDDPEYRAAAVRRQELLRLKLDGTLTAAQAAELEWVTADYERGKDRVGARTDRTVSDIRAIMDDYRDRGSLHLGGLPMIAVDLIRFIRSDLVIFGAGVFLFMVAILGIVFRSGRWILLPLLSCAYASTLMIGLLGLVGWQVTVISSNFIALMLIITMEMNIHLTVRYRELHSLNPDIPQHELMMQTVKSMFMPCLYSVLTTMVGFGSLVVSNIKPVIDFGWMMTLGLFVLFVVSFLLFPAILIQLPRQEARADSAAPSPFTNSLARLTERQGGLVMALWIACLGASLIGITRLEVENSFVNYFSDDTEIYQSLKHIDQQLGGTTPIDIVVRFPAQKAESAPPADAELSELFGEIESAKADTWFTPDKMERIRAVHEYLEGLHGIGKVVSLETMVRVGQDLNQGRPFDTFELGVIYKRLPQELKDAALDPYIFIDEQGNHDEARISARVIDSLPDLRRNELIKKIDHDLGAQLGIPRDQYRVGGLLVLYNNVLQSLFRSQILSLGAVLLGIAIMLVVLFRSLTLAIIGIVPNILAALAILGYMGLLGMPLDLMTITIASITVGIGVDNCIHYIYRFRDTYARSHDYGKTLYACHASIGKAMFYTSLTIMVGFSILMLSNFIPTIYFGALTAAAMAVALLGALTLLPRLILIIKPFGPLRPR